MRCMLLLALAYLLYNAVLTYVGSATRVSMPMGATFAAPRAAAQDIQRAADVRHNHEVAVKAVRHDEMPVSRRSLLSGVLAAVAANDAELVALEETIALNDEGKVPENKAELGSMPMPDIFGGDD